MTPYLHISILKATYLRDVSLLLCRVYLATVLRYLVFKDIDIKTTRQSLYIGWNDMDSIDLARDMDQWRALVNTVINLRFHKMLGSSSVAAQLAASQEGLSPMSDIWRTPPPSPNRNLSGLTSENCIQPSLYTRYQVPQYYIMTIFLRKVSHGTSSKASRGFLAYDQCAPQRSLTPHLAVI
jgi:hypothetical protein